MLHSSASLGRGVQRCVPNTPCMFERWIGGTKNSDARFCRSTMNALKAENGTRDKRKFWGVVHLTPTHNKNSLTHTQQPTDGPLPPYKPKTYPKNFPTSVFSKGTQPYMSPNIFHRRVAEGAIFGATNTYPFVYLGSIEFFSSSSSFPISFHLFALWIFIYTNT